MNPNEISRILLVDDETAITDNLASFLNRSGFVVVTASEASVGTATNAATRTTTANNAANARNRERRA